mmetsp:Transcript_52260/g.169794  ORF Transcript_52260/g.169794 Transcript_52260/m.169794 type:complete len:318 (-) Transcript_52260:6-959(-)
MAQVAIAAAAKARRFAPSGAALSARDIDALADFVAGAGGGLLTLTGAGCSTESGVPDYRSPQGSYAQGHKPMIHAAFVGEPLQRARYWARSLRGWRYFTSARPNEAHLSLAGLEQASYVSALVTQNVDGLHSKAGSKNVVDLHGRNDAVVCRSCAARRPRVDFQEELEAVNAEWMGAFLPQASSSPEDIRADGDAHLAHGDLREFRVPGCSLCGGVLMPDVVFFGGALKPEVRDAAQRRVEEAGRLLVIGSSCQVFSAFRLVQAAQRAGKPIAMVNIGPTRADPLIPESLRFSVRCGEALGALCARLGVEPARLPAT